MRHNLYNTKSNKLDQGAIFNGICKLSELNKSHHGIVITPRCDIDQAKVEFIHYLPLIEFDDWLKHIVWENLISKQLQNKRKELNQLLVSHGLSEVILDPPFTDGVVKNLFESKSIKSKEKNDLIGKIQKYRELSSTMSIEKNERNPSILKTLVPDFKTITKDLIENKKKEYYLLENWHQEGKYFVVLTRELQTLPISVARHIEAGLEINHNYHLKYDFRIHDEFSMFQATLKSPFIEHLIHHFLTNFNRIGIQDHPNNTLENLTK